ncbi:MAG: hypothetical protein FWC68_05660, partial [Oscillospiraceae bacterium]|nr:hypothetical protein [Oscillospiraceae bacterium]
MKVLFAVNNDNISDAIVKKYQKEYRQILSYKNVYYFNAILKELQKDKTYNRVVISEDLEPFANNNYDTIDKFLFDKLDNISDEANDDMEIVLICADRRGKSDEMLVKIFGIGVYSAIVGQDRSIDEVCKLINKPRTKKEAKIYYKIESDNVSYQAESENSVSEAEVQNILAHYKRLGKNEDKYVDSFNNIISQYTDIQLKIIIRYLPMNVKAVLEERSPKYQELMTFSKGKDEEPKKDLRSTKQKTADYKAAKRAEAEGVKLDYVEKQLSKNQITKPIIVPEGVSNLGVRKLISEEPDEETMDDILATLDDVDETEETDVPVVDPMAELVASLEEEDDSAPVAEENPAYVLPEEPAEPVKRGRGRPKKIVPGVVAVVPTPGVAGVVPVSGADAPVKRGRGRPKKVVAELVGEGITPPTPEPVAETPYPPVPPYQPVYPVVEAEPVNLFGLDEEEDDDDFGIPVVPPPAPPTPNYGQPAEEPVNLFGLDDDDEEEPVEDENVTNIRANFKETTDTYDNNQIAQTSYTSPGNLRTLLTQDKKIVAFVGTTKNGTSFIVNNVAELLSGMGISTAILDLTKSKNAYYIYTKNEENLRQTAANSISKLKSGVIDGIKVSRTLSVYTSLPGEEKDFTDVESILATLVKEHSLVLIDCDFDTDPEYFAAASEIFLVQSMDVLTIQPLT